MKVEGIVWMGVRTAAYPQMHHLFADVMGMDVTKKSEGVSWMALPGGEEIQLYDDRDTDHTFFSDAPVVGFRVADYDEAHAALEAAGVEWIGGGDRHDQLQWRHFRAPDGNVYEILGPRSS